MAALEAARRLSFPVVSAAADESDDDEMEAIREAQRAAKLVKQ